MTVDVKMETQSFTIKQKNNIDNIQTLDCVSRKKNVFLQQKKNTMFTAAFYMFINMTRFALLYNCAVKIPMHHGCDRSNL